MFDSIKDAFSQITGLVRPHLTGRTAFLKRKIYGDYITVRHYKCLVGCSLFSDIALICALFFAPDILKGIMGNSHWTMEPKWNLCIYVIFLVIILIFCVSITYNLIMYPHMYKRDKLPILTYYEVKSNKTRKVIVLDMTQNEILVRDLDPNTIKNGKFIGGSNCNERLLNLNNIKVYHNDGIYKVNNESISHKDLNKSKSAITSDLSSSRSKISSLKSEVSSLNSTISSMKSKSTNEQI